MSLAQVQSAVDDLVRDTDQVISTTQRDDAIDNALARFSVDLPRAVVADIVAASGVLPLPSDWQQAHSEVMQAEFPIGERPLAILAASMVTVESTPSGDAITLDTSISDGDTVRLSYTAAHTLDPVDTLTESNRYALSCLASAYLCGQLAAKYSNDNMPTIGADSVDHGGVSARWRARQRDLMAEYKALVGSPKPEREAPASAYGAPPRRNSLGRSRLFHPPSSGAR